MRNLLIIGNGFDIDLGLKTKYSDFIESNCFDENKNNLFKSIYRSYKNMNWIDLENELKNMLRELIDKIVQMSLTTYAIHYVIT